MRPFRTIALWVLLCAAAPPVEFVPVNPRLDPAADEYRRLWDRDGARIVAALEQATGLAFPATAVDVIVTEGPPMTGYDGHTVRLRAGYSPAYKLATLVHEMGHLLVLDLARDAGMDDHRLLYLFLYDVWTDLYGRDFAERMVRIERRIPGPSDYDGACNWALALTREQRQARLRELRGIRAQASAKPGADSDRPRLSYAVEANPNTR